MKFLFFYIAIFTYTIFILYSAFIRVGKSKEPLTAFNRLHFIFISIYFVLSFALILFLKLNWIDYCVDFLVGLFLFFSMHYAIFLNFYSLAQRSISSSFLILLSENKGQLTEGESLEKYADGKGFGYIKQSRLEDMLNLGWLTLDQGKYYITRKGNIIIRFVKIFLRFWGLTQLGKP